MGVQVVKIGLYILDALAVGLSFALIWGMLDFIFLGEDAYPGFQGARWGFLLITWLVATIASGTAPRDPK